MPTARACLRPYVRVVRNIGEAFIDESFLGCTSTHQDRRDLTFQENQQQHKLSAFNNLHLLGQRWEWLLFTTSGALNLQESCWMLMSWKWTQGEARLELPSPASPKLESTAGYDTSSPIPVPNLSPNNSYRTLIGVYISPSGSTKKAQEILLSHSIDYASSIVNSRLTKEEAYLSYITVLFPKFWFPLPVLTLTELQCNRIQSPAIQALLPKMHVNRHTSRAIVFGPLELGGVKITLILSLIRATRRLSGSRYLLLI